jgi:hypothetical protein
MIDSSFIIRYTNGLYSTPTESAPRYDEFRDMFSSGQIASKEWAVKELSKLDIVNTNSKILIVGSWFGTLGLMLQKQFPNINLKLIDIDPRCEIFLKNIGMPASTVDMYYYQYTEDIVVNTSCEHISNLEDWIKLVPKGTLFLLQSNNNREYADHINCVDSIEDFVLKSGLKKILYSGELKMPMYTRYMILGKS